MPRPELNRRMSALDAAFYYSENEKTPMHIGGIDILEGEISVEEFKKDLDRKLDAIPRYRQVLTPAPLNVGQPTWEDDEAFDIDNHIEEVALPKPGSEPQLMRVAGKLFEGVLDREHPLWKVYVVHGLEKGRSALVWLLHHCMVDGVSGVELWELVMNTSPELKTAPNAELFTPRPRPQSTQLLTDALWDTAAQQVDNWSDLQRNSIGLARSLRGEHLTALLRNAQSLINDFTRPLPKLPFNSRGFSGKRRLSWSSVSFAEIRAIRNNAGGTVNDVILATLGGALEKYMKHHGLRTRRRNTRIMVPVNVRPETERGTLGNRVSLLPVDIPLDAPDPIVRLQAVSNRTGLFKQLRVADIINLLSYYWQGTHPALQRMFGAAAFTPQTQPILDLLMPRPLMHMVCTNVPAPQIPLYCMGHKVLAHYPLLPVAPGMGLNMGVFSYNQQIFFGFIADTKAAPDVRRFNRFLDEAFVQLRDAAGVEPIEPIEIRTPKPQPKDESARKTEPAGTNGRGNGMAAAKAGAAAK